MSEPDKTAAWLENTAEAHGQHVSANYPSPGVCVSRCAESWPCRPYLMATALLAVLEEHRPEQLHALVEDYKGKVVCPHGEHYDGGEHYEDDQGWHCKSTPTVVVCSSCCDPDDDTLRSSWRCATRRNIETELGVKP
jgi:hypothetical protein